MRGERVNGRKVKVEKLFTIVKDMTKAQKEAIG